MATISSEEEGPERRKLEESIYEACRRSLEGSDFLVSAFVQSLYSYRRPSVCTPFPTALFTTIGDFKDKDFAAAASAVQSFPALQDIVPSRPCGDNWSSSGYGRAAGDETLKAANRAGDNFAGTSSSTSSSDPLSAPKSRSGSTYANLAALSSSPCHRNPTGEMSLRALKLLDWILRFRHRIEFVQDPAKELAGLFPPASSLWAPFRREVASEASVTPHYVLKIHDTDESESGRRSSMFEAAKAESGSILAYHGTSAENLHSILRCGLINMSNTQLQRNGAIFGEGVYLSTDPAVAYSFCKAGDGWERSRFGSRVRYLLVCEVGARHFHQSEASSSDSRSVAERDARAARSHGRKPATANGLPETYILVQNTDLVKLRYVFVYSDPPRAQQSVGSSTGPHNAVAEGARRRGSSSVGHAHKLGLTEAFRKIDWCKAFIVLYIALLVGVGLLKSNAVKYGRGSFGHHFWPFYQ